MTQRPRPQTRPLDGLRVLDLSRAVSGPLAGRILADLGADVVRAELPGTDVTQAFGKVTRGRSGLYSHVNAGKRSIDAVAVITRADEPTPPCGGCRQVLNEFGPDMTVTVESGTGERAVWRLSEILPHAFGPSNLGK